VQATPQGNPLTWSRVSHAVPELERNLPPSMKMKVAYDSTKFSNPRSMSGKDPGRGGHHRVVVIFLFLASFRSVLIPVVTIPLSLIGVCSPDAGGGVQFQPLDAAGDGAGDRARGRRCHRGGGKHPSPSGGGQATGAGRHAGRARDRRPGRLHDHHAGRGLCADRFLGGLTGSLFREFAFTLAGSVIVSGVIALTLSPMMCSIFLTSAEEGRFAKLVNRVSGDDALVWAATRPVARLPPDYRPVRADHAWAGRFPVYAYVEGTRAEEDQGIVFAVTKAPKYANIDYVDFYGEKLDKVFGSFPETDLRFVLNGINGPQGGIAGMLLKPWTSASARRSRSSRGTGSAQQDRRRQRVRVQPAAAARKAPAACRCRW